MVTHLKQVYELVSIELDKIKSPVLLLDQFNALFLRAQENFFEQQYAVFEKENLVTEMIQCYKRAPVYFTPSGAVEFGYKEGKVFNAPDDYWRLSKAFITYEVVSGNVECLPIGNILTYDCSKLLDMHSISSNVFLQEKYYEPYYYIYDNNLSKIPNIVYIFGSVPRGFIIKSFGLFYLSRPKIIQLVELDLNNIDPLAGPQLDYPESVGLRIVDVMVKLQLERQTDPRLQTFPLMNPLMLNK